MQMKLMRRRHEAFALMAACVALALCPLTAAARPGQRGDRDTRQLVFTESVLREAAREVSVVEAAPPAGLGRKHQTTAPGGRYVAFTVEDSSGGGVTHDRIFFTDLRARRTFEVKNLPDAHRPFDDLLITRGAVLQFDRWGAPHRGVRYRLDLRRRRLVSARVFFDADYVERQRQSPPPHRP